MSLQTNSSFMANRIVQLCYSSILLVCCLCALSTICAAASGEASVTESGKLVIPQLTEPFVVDGNISEWSSAARVPMMSASHISAVNYGHKWNGIQDAGMEVLAAWNSKGLCLAAIVSDDDVRNNRNKTDYWQQDCVEFMVDGRTGSSYDQYSYSHGAYQILVRPPVGGKPADAAVVPRDGYIPQMVAAGKRTTWGYTIELLIPWKAFPGIKPQAGANIGLHFALDESDARDGDNSQPMQMMWHSKKQAWQYPGDIARWELQAPNSVVTTDIVHTDSDLDVPMMLNEKGEAHHFHVFAAKPLAGAVKSARVMVAPDVSIPIKDVNLASMPEPFSDIVSAEIQYPTKGFPVGDATVTAELLDGPKVIGTLVRDTQNLGPVIENSIRRIRNANVSVLSGKSPFKAAHYLEAAACVEEIKRGIGFRDSDMARAGSREVQARLDLLEKGSFGSDGLYDLLKLAADPESQVVVQYYSSDYAGIGFFYGAVPLAYANVAQYRNETDAAEAAKRPGYATANASVTVSGSRVIRVLNPSKAIADQVAKLIIRGTTVTPVEVDALRTALIESLAPTTAVAVASSSLYFGEVSSLTFFKDNGMPSPVERSLRAMSAFQDYNVITDYKTIHGAQLAECMLNDHGFAYSQIVGESAAPGGTDLSAFPLKQELPPSGELDVVIKAAHEQNAVVQLMNPTRPFSDARLKALYTNRDSARFDAWENVSVPYSELQKSGRLPAITGGTNAHGEGCGYQLTIIDGKGCSGGELADAMRSRRTAMVGVGTEQFLYGPPDITNSVWSALKEGKGLKADKAQRLSNALRKADLSGLIEDSPDPTVRY